MFIENLKFEDFDVEQLRNDNVDSIFLTEIYDDAIAGINEKTKSIVYSLYELVELEISLRFEEGGLNPEYDEVDDDLLIVCQDSIFKLFQMIYRNDKGILPTLYTELTEMTIDPFAPNICSSIEFVLGEKVYRASNELDMKPKEFTYDQLSDIVSDNDAEYLRWIELQQFNPSSTFELVPRELMDFDDNEPIIRTVVKLTNEPFWLGFQDLTFDQWEEGKAINKKQNAA